MFNTRLVKGRWETTYSEMYECHRAGVPRRRGQQIRRSRYSKKCGCLFSVAVSKTVSGGCHKFKLTVMGPHTGHDPTAPKEIYHLPVHPSVIDCCMDDLFDVGCVRHVSKMSMRKEKLHKDRVSELDRLIYRFFMLPKEVQNNAAKLNISNRLSDHDWYAMMQEAYRLMQQGKVLHVQPYVLEGDNAQPFILILQDEWMLYMCCQLSVHNAWALDSTFRTNQFGLPLYVAVAPNKSGVGIPLWYMLCSSKAGSNNEKDALEMTLRLVFKRMGSIRPNAIVIDKSWLEFNAIKKVVESDAYCWSMVDGVRKQVRCQLLLCWFHVKKAWVDYLLPKVPAPKRDRLYMS